MLHILLEDRHLIVCIKPIGVNSQPGAGTGAGEDMVTLLKEYRREKNEDDYIGPVHRLDCGVGGVMVFAKTKEAAGKLSNAINEKCFLKEYLAVVNGCPEETEGIYKDLLFKDSSKNKSFVVQRIRKGVKEASLDYKVLESITYDSSLLTLVKIHLHTGRTHQIRVQFSSRKMPLLGDGKYGSSCNKSDIALWSYRLAFIHPITKKQIDISRLPNNMFPWNQYSILDEVKE